ncbi:MAG TPA: DUF885 domain-containing protein [Allosphingosinicella sp.]|jgi:uncharacterized protein (DUF885 family)|uniref:DUF885 domain-containing protein n=1 Tax=Allosphingosinicella sp. TaxID=2823234 RepID=UPI002F2A6EB3
MTLSRRNLIQSAGAAGAMALLPSCAARTAAAPQGGATSSAAALLDQIAEEHLQQSPTTATALGIDTGARASLRARLPNVSPAGRKREIAWLRSAVNRLERANAAGADAANLEIVATSYRNALDGSAFGYGDVATAGWRNGPYVVAQNMGSYLDVPRFLDSQHKVESAADAEAYLSRLTEHARQLDGETARLRADRARGVIAPAVVLDKTLSALRKTREGSPREWLIVTSLARRAKDIPGEWGARAERIAAAQVAPALDRQIAELALHRRRASDDFGVWKLPKGEAYYAWALRAATTTRRTPDEIHQQGLEELASFTAQMDRVMRQLGFANGSVGERFRAMVKDPRYAFAEGDKGRAEIMAFIEAQIAELRPRLPRAFATPVKGDVEVRRIPPAEELGAPGAYGGAGSIDGTIPGRFWINLRSPDMHSRIDLPSLTYHEALPGHVWQGEYVLRLPLIRTVTRGGFSAFGEGWGLYAEQLAGELGVYADNPEGQLGYLQSMAFRAARLVVDTGIHSKRWTRDRALSWFAEATGGTIESVAGEIDRYAVWPGQACGYKVGHTEINRQRDRAKKALGDRFDLRAFNDLVVGGGSRPLTMLEREIDMLVAQRSG